jgi:hypothetical protein
LVLPLPLPPETPPPYYTQPSTYQTDGFRFCSTHPTSCYGLAASISVDDGPDDWISANPVSAPRTAYTNANPLPRRAVAPIDNGPDDWISYPPALDRQP